MRNTTSVSLKGDDLYKSQVKKVAAMLGMSLGALVRTALDSTYSKELEQLSFFYDSVDQNQHNDDKEQQPAQNSD